MYYPEAIKILLLLKSIPGLGSIKLNSIIKYFNSSEKLQNIFSVETEVLLSLNLTLEQINYIRKPNWFYVDGQLSLAQKHGVSLISIYDSNYPLHLKQIYDPPVLLYVKGNSTALNAQLFAIVGTRRPTIYGRKMAEYFSKEVLSVGYVVTSGFAKGIDICAHLTAANQSQPTVVVLGTSLDYIYPTQHKNYVDNILNSNGVIISENGFTTPPHPSCFPKRNRIISGLSKGVLVIEAARKSGSLITAKCAVEQAREVFAVPGNINNPQALGCLDLISQGAKLTVSIEDILDELCGLGNMPMEINAAHSVIFRNNESIQSLYNKKTCKKNIKQTVSKQTQCGLSKQQQCLLELLSGGVVELDALVQSIKMDISRVLTELVQLEIMGLVVPVPGGYTRCNESW